MLGGKKGVVATEQGQINKDLRKTSRRVRFHETRTMNILQVLGDKNVSDRK